VTTGSVHDPINRVEDGQARPLEQALPRPDPLLSLSQASLGLIGPHRQQLVHDPEPVPRFRLGSQRRDQAGVLRSQPSDLVLVPGQVDLQAGGVVPGFAQGQVAGALFVAQSLGSGAFASVLGDEGGVRRVPMLTTVQSETDARTVSDLNAFGELSLFGVEL
jgi:hypothetical protein